MLMRKIIVLLFFIIPNLFLFAQYYSGIDPNSSNFITDLETLIRSNYVRISYDDYKLTIIPDYESWDNGDSTRNVKCVYTGYVYNYTPPFAWGTLSREHTWCYSWMPSYGSKSTDEYSDQHHLFPTHQNNANARRSNHPLGIVDTVTYRFLDGKLGKNSSGETVYEPRDEHKGDAARALLYMTIRYDGTDGNTWNFNWLNNVKLPDLNEAQQSLDILLQWHKQDPPDKWEVERNDYIYSKQKNRNPFVDHPEYVSYIDFNDLTKLSPVFADEPEHQPDAFSVSIASDSLIVTWNDAAAGTQAPSGYLLMGFAENDYFIPMDGVVYSNDNDFSDGKVVINVEYSAEDKYVFTEIDTTKSYYFRIYSFNGNSDARNYNIDSPPSANVLSSSSNDENGGGNSENYDLYFTEYVEGSSYNKALEIYNKNSDDIDLSAENYIIEIYFNGSESAGASITLNGIIRAHDVYVVAHSSAEDAILNVADQTSGSLSFNGDDAVVLKKNGEVLDVIGEVGFDPGTEWGSGLTSTADNTLRFKDGGTPDKNPDDAYDPQEQFNGYEKDDVSDLGNYSAPTPVELTFFTANANGNSVTLNWQTATEINNYGFQVERQKAKGESSWEKIGFVEGAGNSNSPKAYSFTDNVTESGTYAYRLKQIDIDGSYEYSNIVEVNIGFPAKFELMQNYPNPFNPTTTIKYSIPNIVGVETLHATSLQVYSILGEEIATLVNEKQSPGNYTVQFDASNLPSGVYFYRLKTGNFVQTKKMLLTK